MALVELLFLCLTVVFAECYNLGDATFRAAVYEHAVRFPPNRVTAVSRKEALTNMMRNLQVYKQQAEKAHQMNVDMMVFPEDGIYGPGFKWSALTPYLEHIPDPRTNTWNPCESPVPDTEVQVFLSCLAKNNSLYLVANFGDSQPCDAASDPKCPDSGHYQYNTDVVYDPTGLFISKYHKVNLFYEFQFSFPDPPRAVYFDTPFGRFGMFTCFDILFYTPTIELVEHYNISNIVFPTAWMDALPLLSSIQFHSAFARGLGVNFLAANIHFPLRKFHGSGIYTPDGVADFYYNDRINEGKLLVSEIPIVTRPSYEYSNVSFAGKDIPKPNFTSAVFHDEFNMVELTSPYGTKRVCHEDLCCELSYTIGKEQHSGEELYAFGAFSGVHTYEGSYAIQVCALIKCENASDKKTCGQPTKVANTSFSQLDIRGNFSVPYIFPEVLVSNNGSLELPPKTSWTYQRGRLVGAVDTPLITAAMYARKYDASARQAREDHQKRQERQQSANGAETVSMMMIHFVTWLASIALSIII